MISSQHVVLPVFYDVDPGQVKKQTGSYAEAFARHEESFRSELNIVHKWRAALKEVADLAGMVLRDRHESQFIQDIVNQVQNKLHLPALYVPPYLVGIDTLITRINWWLKQDGHIKVGIAAICGIGGIGKTTIAKVVYNQNIHGFKGYSFLANVRETSRDCNGLLRLQRQLISDILKGKAHKIYNTDNGINKIKEAVCCRRVLIVLDDVEDFETVRKLIGSQVPFHPGSKIIITSRHRFVSQTIGLEASSGFADLSKLFEVKELNFNESLQLFHWYAFGCNSMSESFMECAASLVKQCGGLPDYMTTILDGCDFYTTIGIENLMGRSLLTINEKNKLMMHQMIRDMGREIIRQESPDVGERSRVWHKDAFDVIREKTGSRTIKCLALDLQGLLENKSKKTATTLHLPKHSQVVMETQAFVKMQRLQLLQLDQVKLKGDFKDFPKSLIWLRWHGFPMQSLPADFDIRRLVALDMRYSNLKRVWKDKECVPNLKILNLNHSHSLLKTPNFSGLPSLEKLMLKDCIKLVEVDQSIGELKMLTFLNLKDCKSLGKLPRTIGSLVSLEELSLSGCSTLDNVPKELHDVKSLKVLNLDGTSIYQTRLWLPYLLLKRNKDLGFSWAYLPCSLVKLSLESCRLSDDAMPHDLCNLASLKSLNLSRNLIHSLPESIKHLTKLDELLLNCCTELQKIPNLPNFSNCKEAFMAVSPFMQSIVAHFFFPSKQCGIFGCEKLTEVQDTFKLEPIENFEAQEIKRLFNVDSINKCQVQLYNFLIDRTRVATPQECGITSTFVAGSEVPVGFKHISNEHQISFSLPKEKIHWFSLCIVFSIISHQSDFIPSVCIYNETKNITWNYHSTFIGVPKRNGNTMLWLIHWPTTNFELEGGDLVSCMLAPIHLGIRKFGVTYESQGNTAYQHGFTHAFPGYEDATRNSKIDLTKDLLSLGSCENVKVQVCNYLQESTVITSPQVLYDYGIITTFHPMPFDHYGRHFGHHSGKDEVSISVSLNFGRKTSCLLNSTIVLSANDDRTFEFLPSLEVVNETKGTKWTYSKHFMGIPETKNTIYWVVCWNFKGGELEAGDRISIRVVSDLCVLEFGVDLVYDHVLDDRLNSFHLLPGMNFGIFFVLGGVSCGQLLQIRRNFSASFSAITRLIQCVFRGYLQQQRHYGVWTLRLARNEKIFNDKGARVKEFSIDSFLHLMETTSSSWLWRKLSRLRNVDLELDLLDTTISVIDICKISSGVAVDSQTAIYSPYTMFSSPDFSSSPNFYHVFVDCHALSEGIFATVIRDGSRVGGSISL
ncbi:hypothetical protein V6N12_036465 [Hibiscus sabdariffa]|uniref:TIR domain-containing protein n=1 Tax=Hibiscus sabdariffa TaxID=183260 RepID=A0ABR2EQN8_9ROSI